MRERGFTLLEMLIVLAIVGGLAFAGGNALQKMRGTRLRDSTTEVAKLYNSVKKNTKRVCPVFIDLIRDKFIISVTSTKATGTAPMILLTMSATT